MLFCSGTSLSIEDSRCAKRCYGAPRPAIPRNSDPNILMKTLPIIFSALVGTASFATAQQSDVFLCDVTQDQLVRLADVDGDGIYLSASEAISFWNNGTLGATSASPQSVEMRVELGQPVAYFVDNSTDIVYRGVDTNGNGALEHLAGEVVNFRDSGVLDGASNANGLALTGDGAVWWSARWDGGSSTMRGIHRLFDLNGDGDANDAGEQVTVVPDNGTVFAPSSVTGGLVPVDTENIVRITELGNGVVAWTGFSGTFSDDFCVYRFEDLNSDGDVNDTGEAINFLNANNKNLSLDQNVDFASGLLRDLATVDGLGLPSGHARLIHLSTQVEAGKEIVYVATDSSDTGDFSTNALGQGVNGLIFRCEDSNLDGDVNDAGETTLYFDGSVSSGGNAFPKIVGMDGVGSSLYVASLNNDTTIFRLRDLNGDGDAMDAGELDGNGGLGLWSPNTWGPVFGDDPVPFDPIFLNYHIFNVDIGAFATGIYADPAPDFAVSGIGCSQYSADIPTIHGSGLAQIGTANFVTEVRNAPGGVPAVLTVGTATNFWFTIPLPFDMAPLGWAGCNLYHNWLFSVATSTSGFGATDGVAALPINLPANPSLVGLSLPMQWAILNPALGGFDLGLTQLGEVIIR